jgi:hypothetical protein
MKFFDAKVAMILLIGILCVSAQIPNKFIRRCGTEFCCGDSAFYFAGTNVYDFFTYGDGADYTDSVYIENNFMNKKRIDDHMARLAKDQVKVVRLWMFDHEKWHGFDSAEGVYNESEFRLFDYVIESARKNGIYLIPTLENYWEAYGGIDQRLKWEGLESGQANRWKFFNKSQCSGCFDQYKNYVVHALNHVNHYSGVPYKDDPVIFAWDLMNEARYENATPNENKSGLTLRAWVDTMASFIKSIDKNHMVYVGIEAHESRFGYGGDEGNPFIYLQKSPYIDFTSAHPYPTESWANLSIDATVKLVHQWITESRDSIGKPFFMGEFNSHDIDNGVTRSQWWQAIYDEMEKSGGAGSAFWWYPDNNYDSKFGVSEGMAELAIFRKHSLNMQAKSKPVGVKVNNFRSKFTAPEHTVKMVIMGDERKINSNLYDIYGRAVSSEMKTNRLLPGIYIAKEKQLYK